MHYNEGMTSNERITGMSSFSQVIEKVSELFGQNSTYLSAAMNEVKTAQAYEGCLSAIDSEYPGLNPFDSLVEWCKRRVNLINY